MSAPELIEVEGLLAPDPRGEEAEWYAAAEQGRLGYTRCAACATAHLPLRALCPACGSTDVATAASAGRGSIYSYTVQRRRPAAGVPVPNIVALVDLDEGFRMLSRIVGRIEGPGEPAIGARVEVRFARCHETVTPVFVLSGEGA
ncbi:Zn-ribbon domain-containing OB-fold protein [Pseudonocardia ailaonensis]|uniref:Zn-ribbon domain-containing OB-fold protein n=1 Tax=Pseudonocardia ailaonensis TaxID=367279 RepID=A0ABN2N351_9PSEU